MRFFGPRRREAAEEGDPTGRRTPRTGSPELSDDELRSQVEGVLLRELTDGLDDPTRVPTPLSRERVTSWLAESDFSYFVDSEGDIGGMWHGWLFHFLVVGEGSEVLQVRGQWHRDLSIERLEEILEICNDWNAEWIWPKAYVCVRDNGAVLVYAEVTVDLEHGVSDEQLDQLLQCGLTTGSMFFEHLDEVYPDPLRSAP
ncbi:YbjN domain-containing protein [Myceligenerans salitolerans]|uniref:YbjN domain-containing protein n=1 Tax=Myceligenerans salitolerans TaxID=1230528 RepID=UPI0027DC6AFA|nr:YbjN domain-containing protein [Myceligenerans salitolerans]